MTPSFTRGEYWLLETVADCRTGIDWVAESDDWVGQALNKRSHGLNREMLLRTLVGLFRKGLIEAMRSERPAFIPEEEQIALAFDSGLGSSNQLYYGLTPEGGRQWESFARADWSLYIDASSSDPDNTGVGITEYICMSKERLECYIELSKQVLTFDPTSAQWDEVRPWQATYWKVLPCAHRVRFCGGSERKETAFDPFRAMCDLTDAWYSWR